MDIISVILIVITVIAIFSVMIVLTEIYGLRTLAKMSSFDFVSTIAVGLVLASIILNEDQSILKGGIILAAIIGFPVLISILIKKLNWLKKMSTNSPRLLIRNGEVFYDQLEKCNVDKNNLMAKLREANVLRLSAIQTVVFESTEDISVLESS